MYHSAIGGTPATLYYHNTLEAKAGDHEFEANLSYTVKSYVKRKQAKKQVGASIDVRSFYNLDAFKLSVVIMRIYIEHKYVQ